VNLMNSTGDRFWVWCKVEVEESTTLVPHLRATSSLFGRMSVRGFVERLPHRRIMPVCRRLARVRQFSSAAGQDGKVGYWPL